MAEIIVDIANLGKYTSGILCDTVLGFPASTQQVQAALKVIGVDGLRYEETIALNYDTKTEGLSGILGPYAHIDELNYLACRLQTLSGEERLAYSAALRHGEYSGNMKDLINLTYNLDCYEFYPDVNSYEEYGRLLVDCERFFSLPELAAYYFDYAAYGEDTAINEGGEITRWGYICNNRQPFREIYKNGVPQEYRVLRYPLQDRTKPPLKLYQNLLRESEVVI